MSIISSRWRRVSLAALVTSFVVAFGAASAGATPPHSNFSVFASNQNGGALGCVASFTGTASSVPNSDHLNIVFTHGGVAFPLSGTGSVCHSLPGLSAGDTLSVTDTTTGQTFTLIYQGRPSYDSGVCPGSKVVTGTMDTPQGSPVSQQPQVLYVIVERPGSSSFQQGTANQSGGGYTAHFANALVAGDHVQADDIWTASVNGNEVSFESATEAVVPSNCAAGGTTQGGTTSGTGGTGGTTGTTGGTVITQPTVTLNLAALDLRHGLGDLFKGGLLVSVNVACPAGHVCVVTIVLVQPGHVPAQASARKHKKHKPRPSFTLARGTVTVTSSGTITVKVRPTALGKRKLKHKRKTTLVLVMTNKDRNTGKAQTQKRTIKLSR